MTKISLVCLLFAIVLLVHVSAQDDSRLSATWQVQKYDISAAVPQSLSDRNLTAKAKLELKNISSRPASTLTLRISPNAEIASVNVNGSNVDFTKGEEKIATGSLQRFMLRIPAVQAGGTLNLTVDYKLPVKDNSGVAALSPIGAQFLPHSFWYPTPNSWLFARGADFAPFRMQVSAPGQTVIASGVEAAEGFEQKFGGQPFFVSGSWETVSEGGVAVYFPKGSGAGEQKRAAELAALANEARTFVSTFLGTAPATPIRIVSVKRGGGFAGGGTILVDDGMFRRTKVDAGTVLIIADSIAKTWLGDAVTVTGDGNGVIREGLSRFLATQFIENKYGKEIADVERLRQRVAYSAVSRRDAPLSSVSPLDDYYFPAVANKGAMVWRLLARKTGNEQFYGVLRSALQDGNLSLNEMRGAFSGEKEFLDAMLDQITDINLQAGLPQNVGGETRVALRNTGSVDATVNVSALLANGQKMSAPTTVRARSFGEVAFRAPATVVRVEIDAEKLYPQIDYSDDVAPREFTDSDLLLAVKRSFDKQDFTSTEKAARQVLREYPRFDDVRVILGRSLLALGRNAEAEKEFRTVLDEKFPTARSVAWANVGLGEIAAKANQNAQAVNFADAAIRADAEYGASLAARSLRKRISSAGGVDDSIKSFFANFDRAAASNRKADLEALVMPGEVSRFASGISGQTVEWKTQPVYADRIDASTILVETSLTVKLLNREPESGTAVYRLTKVGNDWKLSGVDIFEVR